jgi:hypothetical protein
MLEKMLIKIMIPFHITLKKHWYNGTHFPLQRASEGIKTLLQFIYLNLNYVIKCLL